jgi:hypothetical protein
MKPSVLWLSERLDAIVFLFIFQHMDFPDGSIADMYNLLRLCESQLEYLQSQQSKVSRNF